MLRAPTVTDPMEMAEQKCVQLAERIEKTKDVLEQISGVPPKVLVRVTPGSITFKLEDHTVSFKGLVDDIKSKFRVRLDKDFNENTGQYLLKAETDGVKIKIINIPTPAGCNLKVREVEVVQKKKQFLTFGKCEAIVK